MKLLAYKFVVVQFFYFYGTVIWLKYKFMHTYCIFIILWVNFHVQSGSLLWLYGNDDVLFWYFNRIRKEVSFRLMNKIDYSRRSTFERAKPIQSSDSVNSIEVTVEKGPSIIIIIEVEWERIRKRHYNFFLYVHICHILAM